MEYHRITRGYVSPTTLGFVLLALELGHLYTSGPERHLADPDFHLSIADLLYCSAKRSVSEGHLRL